MRKIFVDYNLDGDTVLTGDDHTHLSVVLRARKGDKVTLCDGSGFDFVYEIADIDRNSTKLKLLEKRTVDSEPSRKVDLFAAPLKSDKFEWVIQKCTELGISEFFPFMTIFVQVKSSSVRIDRLSKIAKEAAQQCGRGKVPLVHEPVDFGGALEKLREYDSVLFLYEGGGALLNEVIDKGAVKTAVVVGSEGGFSEAEADELSKVGATVSLGKRILRAETASVAATALVMHELGEL